MDMKAKAKLQLLILIMLFMGTLHSHIHMVSAIRSPPSDFEDQPPTVVFPRTAVLNEKSNRDVEAGSEAVVKHGVLDSTRYVDGRVSGSFRRDLRYSRYPTASILPSLMFKSAAKLNDYASDGASLDGRTRHPPRCSE
ncbi:hypothetical protein AXG93_598s1050 [Marchantia polymorpha subsp. ruderalis]|uniref:Uncharacterized protein n=1 Tax=Marchantia polymorpha subsp. ruderalis TaxID=1480154 RepID=A0A176VXM4_MARPO|nr:hypothetical protein AXG93_598s1050 [Marchantia polymorpha subsp. ruderalis]